MKKLPYHKTKKSSISEGSTLSTSKSYSIYANSHGFLGETNTTCHYLDCIVLAKDSQGMQRDSYYTTSSNPQSLESIEYIAKQAAKKTIAKLGAQSLKTQKTPVIFSAEISKQLFSHFLAAISGRALYQKTSFLLDTLNQPIFSKHINLIENPYIQQGLGSAAFDREGIQTQKKHIIQNGILNTYLLSSYAARRLNMQPTGNTGGVHNLILESDFISFKDLLTKMDTGLYVTDVMGQGVNLVTGDYSQGAQGFWVENGQIQYSVDNITIAGNLKNLFQNIVAAADDFDYRGNIQTGSILVEELMLAGE